VPQIPVAGAHVPAPFWMEQFTLVVPTQLPLPSHASPEVQALLSLHLAPAFTALQLQPSELQTNVLQTPQGG
jgi:hypothetical protein